MYLDSPSGFYITKVVSGMGADKAGLEKGNIITKVDGKKVTELSVIKNSIYSKNIGDKVTLTVSYLEKNEYKEKEVEVTIS